MAQKIFNQKYEKFDDVIFKGSVETEMDTGEYQPDRTLPPLDPGTRLLEKGYRKDERYRPTICDILLDRDVAFQLRDGTTLYADIYRPTDESKKYPVLLVWTPYGKLDPPNNYDLYAGRANMKRKYSTGLDTFEGPEPDYWVSNDYIIAVVDSRGSTYSEGTLLWGGYQEGLDAYDTVEWLAAQPWSNGKIGMVGNSWLAFVQYYTAELQPPHLAAIAPWEGWSDTYRDVVCRGGMPGAEFTEGLNTTFRIKEGVESLNEMIKKYPFMNEYWENEKRVDFEKIEVPAYVTASWMSQLHVYGTFRAFKKISSKEKWLRVHNTQEWFDQQTPKYRDDLRKFYDHYLKGLDNGWEKTPKVRVSILDPTGQDICDIPEEDWPLPETEYRKMFLNGKDNSLSYEPVAEEATASYPVGFWHGAEDRDAFTKDNFTVRNEEGQIKFRMTFKEDTVLCGYFKAHLFVSTDQADDMDLFMYVTKEDSMGWPYYPITLGVDYYGAEARLRVSHRKIENTEYFDWRHEHKTEEPIQPGEIVEIETIFWPMGMLWREGETMVLTISSKDEQLFEFPTSAVETRNKGNHFIHTGGQYDSYIEVPYIKK